MHNTTPHNSCDCTCITLYEMALVTKLTTQLAGPPDILSLTAYTLKDLNEILSNKQSECILTK